MNSLKKHPPVLWRRVFGLAMLSAAIAFAWLAYILYLPKLLGQLGFPPVAVPVLLVIEGLLTAAVEPWMGSLSDERQRRFASRYPLIVAGTVAACVLFVVLPLVVVAHPGGLLRWILPLLLIGWSFAMAVFRSPALALLSRYAAPSSMPVAAAVLSIATGIASAFGPLGRPWLLGLGAPALFCLASGVLLLAVLVLRRLDRTVDLSLPYGSIYISTRLVPPALGRERSKTNGGSGALLTRLGLIFCAGAGASLGFRLLTDIFPKVLAAAKIVPAPVMGTLFLTFAALAIPAGLLAVRVGNGRTMATGLVAMSLLICLVPVCKNAGFAFALALALGAAHSLVINGLYAFALGSVPPEHSGLGIGLYFGGGGLAMAAAGVVATQLQALGIGTGLALGSAGFLLAALCVVLTGSITAAPTEANGTPAADSIAAPET
ncbi:MFS transporter [Gloeobacter kilaueensis]|uniref:Major facilitator transporter n=1 Tax=Gloeobacter kilaueensis (strain ATCC BAA-2537 / CCAP 1431/1 / ULC 316 / JS1) TaxID=1183438 RepID=U5QIT9_GLOK1|nr:MFS transporter [Gloeobacter kilaueensis]AGY57539.1 major facilitator transporter [Gloeobacter kilaueensis JS1]